MIRLGTAGQSDGRTTVPVEVDESAGGVQRCAHMVDGIGEGIVTIAMHEGSPDGESEGDVDDSGGSMSAGSDGSADSDD
jgi:hypothetical protein